MANVAFGCFDTFNMLLSGSPSLENRSFLQRHVQDVGQRLGSAGQRFAQRAREMYDSFDFDGIARNVTAIKRRFENRWQPDEIRTLRTIGEMQHAGPTLQRQIMANPVIRNAWMKGRCDGWSRTYVDLEPGAIGNDHTEYREITNGFAVFDEEGHSHFVSNLDLMHDGLTKYSFEEQSIAQDNWALAEMFYALGRDDMTSVENNAL